MVTKIIDNKQYVLHKVLPTKVRADYEARYQRGWGHLARVLKNKTGGVAVWVHWRR